MKKFFPVLLSLAVVFLALAFLRGHSVEKSNYETRDSKYWFVLHRNSNAEELFYGVPGEREGSELVRVMDVKPGVSGESPTPLPSLLGREYWVMIDKWDERENPETGPYFLQLDIDAPSDWPYGPVPYEECGGQCDWGKPGYFGLHGTGDDPTRISPENAGSLGCIRHSNEDIAYLYNLLDPKNQEIRYYIEDN